MIFLCLPALETQVAFLKAHPECGLVGAWAQIWVGNTPTNRVHRHPCSSGEIAFALLFNAPFVNTSCIFKRRGAEVDWWLCGRPWIGCRRRIMSSFLE
jgi:hypothetical protein